MKRYEKYKPSGIDWIGDVPVEWLIMKLKRCCHIVRGGSPRPIDAFLTEGDGYNWIKIGDTEKGNKYITHTEEKIKKTGLNYTRFVHVGDLILSNSMSFGQPYILKIDGCIHDGWLSLSDLKVTDKEYLYYLLQSNICKIQFEMSVDGGVVKNLNIDKVGMSLVFLPPLKEQTAIAAYLDAKCSKIDNVVAVQQKRIELLKELKQSIITHAVTRGLDKNAKLKDSGVEWIGEVPEEWKICRIKNVLELLTDYDANGSFADIAKNCNINNGNPYAWMVRATDLANNRYGIVDGNNYCDYSTYKYLRKSSLVSNDVLIAKRGEIGKVYIVPECSVPMTLAPNTYLLKVKLSKIEKKFLYYLLSSDYGKISLMLNNKSTTLGALYKDDVKDIQISVPPIDEQKRIITFIEKKSDSIDRQIGKVEKQIELLKEYKQSVITECVTGKRKVC